MGTHKVMRAKNGAAQKAGTGRLGVRLRPDEVKRERLRLLLRLVREERWRVAVALTATILGASLEGVGLGLLIPLLKSVSDPAAEPIRIGRASCRERVLDAGVAGTLIEKKRVSTAA